MSEHPQGVSFCNSLFTAEGERAGGQLCLGCRFFWLLFFGQAKKSNDGRATPTHKVKHLSIHLLSKNKTGADLFLTRR
ncbi:MAG: hypothetical protein C0613_11105 [Desulfobulbaceae bacterium]|nr:MAG: hypothetical protein C0613_11105 [Desulfobulbaceae bacterium]